MDEIVRSRDIPEILEMRKRIRVQEIETAKIQIKETKEKLDNLYVELVRLEEAMETTDLDKPVIFEVRALLPLEGRGEVIPVRMPTFHSTDLLLVRKGDVLKIVLRGYPTEEENGH